MNRVKWLLGFIGVAIMLIGCASNPIVPMASSDAAGTHIVAATSADNTVMMRFDAEAGSNYFIDVYGDSSLRSGDVGLDQIQDEAKGKQMVQDTQRAESLF
jgi:hypothetical protein